MVNILTSLFQWCQFCFKLNTPPHIGVIGIYQKHHDQLIEDVEVFNKWAEGK